MHSALDRIDHIVVLMLENRSFDNMLGWLYDEHNDPPFDHVPRDQPFEGVAGKDLSNPIPADVAGADRKEVPVARGRVVNHPDPDPGEDYPHVNRQLFGQADPPDPVPAPASMTGFVKDYVRMLKAGGTVSPRYDDYRIIMDCFTPNVLPVLSGLAHAYAVCDQWFCAVPSQTMCNRAVFHAGTSSGLVNNQPYERWLDNTAPTIFNRLEQAGLPWKVYFDRHDLVSLTWLIHRSLFPYFHSRFAHMEAFYEDAARGSLGAYTFIEPRFLLKHNDQHPPTGVLPGEVLIQQVYEAVRSGPAWERTLLIITYDEHGGCYDHVSPQKATPPGDGASCPQGFAFDRLGVRVPAVLISPWIEAGTVFRTDKPMHHTSVIRTICRRWNMEPLTERDAAAPDLSPVLTRSTPRTDAPSIAAHPLEAATYQPTGDDEPVNDLHGSFAGLVAAHVGRELPSLPTVRHAHGFVHEALENLLPR